MLQIQTMPRVILALVDLTLKILLFLFYGEQIREMKVFVVVVLVSLLAHRHNPETTQLRISIIRMAVILRTLLLLAHRDHPETTQLRISMIRMAVILRILLLLTHRDHPEQIVVIETSKDLVLCQKPRTILNRRVKMLG